jgi:hypothetical protein
LRLEGVLEQSEFHDGRRIMKRHQFNADKVLGERLIKEARLARKAWLAREKAEQLPRSAVKGFRVEINRAKVIKQVRDQ